MRALAVTVSNRAAAGVYPDRSGPVLVDLLRRAGCDVVDGPLVIPDGDPVEEALRDSVAAGYDVVVTTGGTGYTSASVAFAGGTGSGIFLDTSRLVKKLAPDAILVGFFLTSRFFSNPKQRMHANSYAALRLRALLAIFCW